MVMPAWYDKLVEAKMHKVTQMSEAETAKEIAEVTEGVKSSFESEHEEASALLVTGLTQAMGKDSSVTFKDGTLTIAPKKKRGRPLGSKNRPKTDAKA